MSARILVVSLLTLAATACELSTSPEQPEAAEPAVPQFAVSSTGYQATDLGTLAGGSQSGAWAISESGQVVGWSETGEIWNGIPVLHAVLWDPQGGIQDLGTLGGPFSDAYGINDRGVVVGTADAPSPTRGFLWDPDVGVLEDLGIGVSYAYGINNLDHVVGRRRPTYFGDDRAFLWRRGEAPVDLGTLGGLESTARAINDRGEVVGVAGTPEGRVHAFLWTQATGMRDLGVLAGGFHSIALDINEVGQVTGQSTTGVGGYHAFLWDPATESLRDLGTLPGGTSYGQGINDHGLVVGYGRAASGRNHAFVWAEGVGMRDLGTLGSSSAESRAFDINNAGQVAGWSVTSSGHKRATVWTLNQPPVADAGHDIRVIVTKPVTFDGSGSHDPDGTIVEYEWDFGDGAVGRGEITKHAFNPPGEYLVTLTVTDDGSLTDADETWVTVLTPADAGRDVLQELDALEAGGDLSAKDARAPRRTLSEAIDQIESGNRRAGLRKLGDFIDQMESLIRSRRLAPELGQPLIDAAQDIIDVLEA